MKFLTSLGLTAFALLAVSCCKNDCDPCVSRTYVHNYGCKVRPDYWTNHGQNGVVISSMRDGVLQTQTFCNGELDGEATYTFPNSSIICCTEQYKSNECQKQVYYYESGQPKSAIEYEGPEDYVVTTWYESGSPKSIEKYGGDFLVSGEYFTCGCQREACVAGGEGERICRDPYGQFICRDEIHGGQLLCRTYYHSNGVIKDCSPYQDGLIHGTRKTFHPDGSPEACENWALGKQEGVSIVFQSGEKYAEVSYVNGIKDGVERRFKDGNDVSQEITWYNGKMHGPTYTYVGDSIQTDWFYKGRMTSRADYESFNIPKKRNEFSQ